MGFFSVPRIYVRIFRNRLLLLPPGGGAAIEVTGDFSHPRMLVGNFRAADVLLRAALQKAGGKNLLAPRPAVIMHPKELLEGGLTDIEERVFLELAMGAGASKAGLWLGEDMDADGIREFSFP